MCCITSRSQYHVCALAQWQYYSFSNGLSSSTTQNSWDIHSPPPLTWQNIFGILRKIPLASSLSATKLLLHHYDARAAHGQRQQALDLYGCKQGQEFLCLACVCLILPPSDENGPNTSKQILGPWIPIIWHNEKPRAGEWRVRLGFQGPGWACILFYYIGVWVGACIGRIGWIQLGTSCPALLSTGHTVCKLCNPLH